MSIIFFFLYSLLSFNLLGDHKKYTYINTWTRRLKINRDVCWNFSLFLHPSVIYLNFIRTYMGVRCVWLFNDSDILIQLVNERMGKGYLSIPLIRDPSYLDLFPSHFLTTTFTFRRFVNFRQFCFVFHSVPIVLRRHNYCFQLQLMIFRILQSLSLSIVIPLSLSCTLFLSCFISLWEEYFSSLMIEVMLP